MRCAPSTSSHRQKRPGLLGALIVACLMACCTVASAHDANLARWDVRAQHDTITVQLRTSGHGLHASLSAANPGVDWHTTHADAYTKMLKAFLASVVVLREEEKSLTLEAMQYAYGHESTVTLTFRRQRHGGLGQLHLDLSRYTDRINQHHLTFVWHDLGRDRAMLKPGSDYLLQWPVREAAAQHTTHQGQGPSRRHAMKSGGKAEAVQ